MSNSIHSSFSKVWVGAIPSGGVMPTTYATTPTMTKLLGLISVETNFNPPTKIDDTEQESPGGYKQYYAGRGEPLTCSMMFSYNKTKLSTLFQYIPESVEVRTQPDYGNIMFQAERADGAVLRSFGYLVLGASDKDEDGRQTLEVTFEGSGPPILILKATTSPVVAESFQTPGIPVA